MAGGNPKRHPSSSSATSRRRFPRNAVKNHRSSNSKPSAFGSRSGETESNLSPEPGIPSSQTTPHTPKLRPVNSPRPDEGMQSALPSLRFLDPRQTPPAPAPGYGIQMLERRTLVLADGSVRTYFALPQNYRDFSPLPRTEIHRPQPGFDRQFQSSPDLHPEYCGDPPLHSRNQNFRDSPLLDWHDGGQVLMPGNDNSIKRKYLDEKREDNDSLSRRRQKLLQLANGDNGSPGISGSHIGRGPEEFITAEQSAQPLKHHEVDQKALKKAFLHFAKAVYEGAKLKNRYLANGKQGYLQCTVCDRDSKHYSDMHSLIMHTYHSDNADSTVDHLGYHKALCVLMGWNYLTPPDSSKSYHLLSAEEAAANLDDLIVWPPMVFIHNTVTGKRADGSVEGLGNRVMSEYLTEIGCKGGKPKAAFNKGGHRGMTIVKFSPDRTGLKEAMKLADYFQRSNHGRSKWALVQSSTLSQDEDNNPDLVKVDPITQEKKRVFYGYLANVSDIDKIEFDLRRKVSIESKIELLLAQ
ncbi:unnamed protein product [Cuscuta epithymum]|uniref:XS domain-containing protein n=1 Tax=Cuscuta epithymum TaxID=186058 RepID=A0AAV0EJP9_9ASTE|nr:unnamed protein product [Cuscuta epithymum]